LFDLTQGMYHGNPKTFYEGDQANPLDCLLDQVQCEPGRRVLDPGLTIRCLTFSAVNHIKRNRA
jgi:hypothetical protein